MLKESLNKSLHSSWIIIKLVIPIYIIADILYFYNTLSYISFLVEPFTSILNLPPETSLAIISGIFLNLYAAVAFAAPLDMTSHQWSILAVFLGVCHSLVVESVIMKKIGISNIYSYTLRFFGGLLIAYSVTLMPSNWFETGFTSQTFTKEEFDTLSSFFYNSVYNAFILTVKIVILISILIFLMDFIKSRKFIQQSTKNISKGFSIVVGVILGITYGAGILIKESNNLKKDDIFYVATFLMICHAIIEDTLLFVIFGADFTMVIVIRTIWAIVLSYIMLRFYQYYKKRENEKNKI
jgi:hypothetical protein